MSERNPSSRYALFSAERSASFFLDDDVDVAGRDRGGDGMAAVRRDLEDLAIVGRLADERGEDVVAHDRRRNW